MSFVGGLLLEMPVQIQESGPLASPYVRESADFSGTTTEPISLGWKDIAINEILDIAVACSQEDWDGAGSAPISEEATFKALNLIYQAPERIRPPEIVPSSDGEIAFEWHVGRDRILSLVPDAEKLLFAAILGPGNNRESGCKPLARGWPDRVVEILANYFPNVRTPSRSHR